MNQTANQGIKLIATDMDGTLLDSQKRLPEETKAVVCALKARGVSFVIASGRQYAALCRDLGALKDDVIFMAENGALIMEGGQQLFIDPLAAQDLPDIIRAGQALPGVCAVLCRAHCALVDRSVPQAFIEHMQTYYTQTQVVDDLAAVSAQYDDVCKVAFYDKGNAEHGEYPALKAQLGGKHAVFLSGEDWVDIMKPGANKGNGMRVLQALKGVGPDHCMAFGDYLNDKEMLQSVTESYAMENALDGVKAVSKYIAPSNDENGVLRTIKARFAL